MSKRYLTTPISYIQNMWTLMQVFMQMPPIDPSYPGNLFELSFLKAPGRIWLMMSKCPVWVHPDWVDSTENNFVCIKDMTAVKKRQTGITIEGKPFHPTIIPECLSEELETTMADHK